MPANRKKYKYILKADFQALQWVEGELDKINAEETLRGFPFDSYVGVDDTIYPKHYSPVDKEYHFWHHINSENKVARATHTVYLELCTNMYSVVHTVIDATLAADPKEAASVFITRISKALTDALGPSFSKRVTNAQYVELYDWAIAKNLPDDADLNLYDWNSFDESRAAIFNILYKDVFVWGDRWDMENPFGYKYICRKVVEAKVLAILDQFGERVKKYSAYDVDGNLIAKFDYIPDASRKQLVSVAADLLKCSKSEIKSKISYWDH